MTHNAREARRLLLKASSRLTGVSPSYVELRQAEEFAYMALDYLRDEISLQRQSAGITMAQFANFLVLCCAAVYSAHAGSIPQTGEWEAEYGKWYQLHVFARNQYVAGGEPTWREVGNV